MTPYSRACLGITGEQHLVPISEGASVDNSSAKLSCHGSSGRERKLVALSSSGSEDTFAEWDFNVDARQSLFRRLVRRVSSCGSEDDALSTSPTTTTTVPDLVDSLPELFQKTCVVRLPDGEASAPRLRLDASGILDREGDEPRHMASFFDALGSNTYAVVAVDISKNNLSVHRRLGRANFSAISQLTKSLRCLTCLQELRLSSCNLRAAGAELLAPFIASSSSLIHIELADNDVTDDGEDQDGVRALASSFRVNKSLKFVDMARNDLGPEDAISILRGLYGSAKGRGGVVEVNLYGNDIFEGLWEVRLPCEGSGHLQGCIPPPTECNSLLLLLQATLRMGSSVLRVDLRHNGKQPLAFRQRLGQLNSDFLTTDDESAEVPSAVNKIRPSLRPQGSAHQHNRGSRNLEGRGVKCLNPVSAA